MAFFGGGFCARRVVDDSRSVCSYRVRERFVAEFLLQTYAV